MCVFVCVSVYVCICIFFLVCIYVCCSLPGLASLDDFLLLTDVQINFYNANQISPFVPLSWNEINIILFDCMHISIYGTL